MTDVQTITSDTQSDTCPACNETFKLTTGNWKQISLPCDPGTTVDDVFGDNLSGTYATDWVVFERDALNDTYVQLALTDTVEIGRGYWIKTLVGSQWVNIYGSNNVVTDFPLESDPAGRSNQAGHLYAYDVCWSDVEVIDSTADPLDCAAAPTCTLSEADAAGIMSRIAYKWTGSAYAAFDGVTPGLKGTLVPWDGFWVEAYKPGTKLRIPATGGNCGAPAEVLSALAFLKKKDKSVSDWYVRLIASSGNLQDSHNILGQLSDSVEGYDSHDLKELPPFSPPYLSVVFPHPYWGDQAGDYTSNFHSLQRKVKDQWYFDVLSSEVGAEVTLSWEGEDSLPNKTYLIDVRTGQRFQVEPGGSYTFTTESQREGFWWLAGIKTPEYDGGDDDDDDDNDDG